MSIEKAAKATRKFDVARIDESEWVICAGDITGHHYFDEEEAQAACDRLNLRAVLLAVRDDSMAPSAIDDLIAEAERHANRE